MQPLKCPIKKVEHSTPAFERHFRRLGNTALYFCIKKGLKVFEHIARRSNPHHINNRGWSYIHEAARDLCSSCIRILEECGAIDGIRTRDGEGKTPFEIALGSVRENRRRIRREPYRELLENLLFGYSSAGK